MNSNIGTAINFNIQINRTKILYNYSIKMSAFLVPAALIFALNVITTQPSAQTNDPTMKALKLGKIQAKRKRKPNVIKFTLKKCP